jgi:hypothetical protein
MGAFGTFLEPAWSIRERRREFRGWLGEGNDSEGGFAWVRSEPSSNRRGRSESAGESSVGGWAWGAKQFAAENAVQAVNAKPRAERRRGFRTSAHNRGPLRVCRACRRALFFAANQERRHGLPLMSNINRLRNPRYLQRFLPGVVVYSNSLNAALSSSW